MDEMGEMSVWLKWFWLFQMEETDEMNKMSVCLKYIWNKNGLHCFNLFRIKMSNTVRNFEN